MAARLARAEGLTPETARALAQEGKAVVWIDGGLHASEVLGAQQLIELVYQLASASDAETLRVLRDVIGRADHALAAPEPASAVALHQRLDLGQQPVARLHITCYSGRNQTLQDGCHALGVV